DDTPSRGQSQLAGERAEKCGLAASVRPGYGEAVAAAELEVDWPEPELSPFDDGAFESGDEVAAATRRLELQLELPGLERLLDAVYALEQAFRLAHLRAQRPGGTAIGAARLLAQLGSRPSLAL